MIPLIERLMGVDTLTDQVIAMDLLVSVKAGIQLYAVAATEAATSELKATFIKHLHETIDTHARVTDYMMERGFYRAYQIGEQLAVDRKTVQTALNIPS
ncbi:MAG: spore coat protein [Symbiobacteriaceae bacterium]|jgi:similar to spore coat protein|nr:spore coat protein [Symbiobacteriaceae bacterium]